MSWFSREWDGAHLEGCPCYPISEDADPDETKECGCAELMIENAIGAAEARYDSMMNR